MPEEPTTTPTEGGPRRSRRRPTPNYAARRMLVSTIAITVIVAAAVFGWRAVTGDGGSSESSSADWDAIALVDRVTGDVTVLDEDGEEQHRIAGTGRILDVHAHRDRLALVGPTAITVTGTDPDAESTAIAIERDAAVVPIETETTLHLLVGDPAGGNLLIVDVTDGSIIDVAEAAAPTIPKLFVESVRVNADGSTFAVADAANFQTIVVGDDIEGAVFLADQPVAVGDDLVATSQVVNLQADVALVDLERTTQAIVPTELPRGGLIVDDELTMVSVGGGIFRIEAGDQEAEQIGTVAIPAGGTVAWAMPTDGGERIVAAGATFESVTDLDGRTIFGTTFASPVDVDRPRPGWRCLPVGGDGTYHSIVDLDSGEQLADLTDVVVTGTSADGCTVIGERNGINELIDRDGVVQLGALRAATLSPDGRALVWTTTAGRTDLVRIDDDRTVDDPVELPGAGALVAVAFLDR